jgi:dipeptidyl-peptidase 4
MCIIFSEQDGWRHLYRIGKDGKKTLITKGNYDVLNLVQIDEANNLVYFHASPNNATQQYLYKTKLDGSGTLEMVTPAGMSGTHNYTISPNSKFALHLFQNAYTKPSYELIELPMHKPLMENQSIATQLPFNEEAKTVEFFKVNIADGTEMDGWMIKPANFDPTKRYPVLFYVYTEPWGANVKDTYGIGNNGRYKGNLADDGYIYMSIDSRGTPAPKGSAWRKSIYRKIGRLNISD